MNKRLILIGFIILFAGCSKEKHPLHGVWKNETGQKLIFSDSTKALWLFPSGSGIDTFHIRFYTDFSKRPAVLDLSDFDKGPLKGKTLYGIVEFGDDYFICDFQAGTDEKVRPIKIDSSHEQRFYRATNEF